MNKDKKCAGAATRGTIEPAKRRRLVRSLIRKKKKKASAAYHESIAQTNSLCRRIGALIPLGELIILNGQCTE